MKYSFLRKQLHENFYKTEVSVVLCCQRNDVRMHFSEVHDVYAHVDAALLLKLKSTWIHSSFCRLGFAEDDCVEVRFQPGVDRQLMVSDLTLILNLLQNLLCSAGVHDLPAICAEQENKPKVSRQFSKTSMHMEWSH